jgi:hypothetical protein
MRRRLGITELVINGYVYDEIKQFAETYYTLRAQVGGHFITAEQDGLSTRLFVDNMLMQQRIRMI